MAVTVWPLFLTQHESMVGWVGVFMLSETVGVYVGLDANFGSRSHLTLFLSHIPSLNPTAGGGGEGPSVA